MLHAATVTYDPARVELPDLLEAVRDVGYDAEPPQVDELLGAPAAARRPAATTVTPTGCGAKAGRQPGGWRGWPWCSGCR